MFETRPTVLLHHTLPDGSSHYDWMLAQDARARDPLITYRLAHRIDQMNAGDAIEAERLGDHRTIYLDYEGPLTRGPDGVDRGAVARVAHGDVRDFPVSALIVRWQGASADHMLQITPGSGSIAVVERLS